MVTDTEIFSNKRSRYRTGVLALVLSLVVFTFVSVNHDHAEEVHVVHCDTCLIIGTIDLAAEPEKQLLPAVRAKTRVDELDIRWFSRSLLSPCSRGPPTLLS